ncbi:MAG TPA: abortive infection system antitoxin AbiGi family protein [Streptosporangiaceae bacterium]|nr:abortive infection system antitoxin AbiGi family protein [Streptosporangiaceae bacterium]
MLGYRGNETWRDMSEYLVHLTEEQSVTSILSTRALKGGGPFGAARNLTDRIGSQQAVCLSEIPLDRLDRLVERRGSYGLGFRKDWIQERDGAPVWYLRKGTAAATAFSELVRKFLIGDIDHENKGEIWKLTRFVDNPSADYNYDFDWEREWRVPDDLALDPGKVMFLIAPEVAHTNINAAWWSYIESYPVPPVLDLAWDLARLQEFLRMHQL